MSAAPGGSYLKFDYALRPSKQVERMLIVEMLHHLSQDLPNLRLSEYSYVGFGSPYYTDFILFHKYLYIKHMVCIEGKPIPKRMDFNKPYDFIDLWMEMFSAFLPRLDRQTPHVLWLDYDTPLSGEHIKDIQGAANVLQAGSFLFVTLDADGRIPDDLDLPDRSDDEKYDDTVQLYRDDFGRYTAETITRSDLAPASLPKLFTSVARNAIDEACRGRGLGFEQLFNVCYADGAQMVSLGGIIAKAEVLEEVRQSSVYEMPFISAAKDPVSIAVPPLTTRERLWMEQNLSKTSLPFELDDDMVASFRELYAYYPTYTENLL